MAAGWIIQVVNFSDHTFTLQTNDGTWRPVINGRQYKPDEAILAPPARKQAIPIPPFGEIPPGPTVLDVSFAMIGWIAWARTKLTGPMGAIDLTIGPTGANDNDYLRLFDEH